MSLFKRYLNVPLLSLICVNTLPIFGVLYWGWSLSSIIWVYWFESFIIGVLNIPKIILSTGIAKRKIKTILFFMVHYMGFWIAHGVFILLILMPEIEKNAFIGTREIETSFDVSFKWVLTSLFLSHFVSFLFIFLRRDRSLAISPELQMFAPYPRVVILHILILAGGYLAAKFGTALSVLVALVLMKICVDAAIHVKSNSQYRLV